MEGLSYYLKNEHGVVSLWGDTPPLTKNRFMMMILDFNYRYYPELYDEQLLEICGCY